MSESITESLAVEDLLAVGGAIAATSNLAFASAVQNQQAATSIVTSGFAAIQKLMVEPDPIEVAPSLILNQQGIKAAL